MSFLMEEATGKLVSFCKKKHKTNSYFYFFHRKVVGNHFKCAHVVTECLVAGTKIKIEYFQGYVSIQIGM